MSSNINVINMIVGQNLCVGCGVCAAICPFKALRMQINEFGEFNPVLIGTCNVKCQMCLEVCPFGDKSCCEDYLGDKYYNLKNSKHSTNTGFYFNSYVAYSKINNQRLQGASGGMATWFLETLLTNHTVDYVVCVGSNNDSEKLFKYQIFNNVEDVRNASKTAYYPVELSEIIREILFRDGHYAIIGLPCFIKALRMFSEKRKKLREKIVVYAGLVCGQMKSVYYTKYLAFKCGVSGKLERVEYRNKKQKEMANNYTFFAENKAMQKGELRWKDGCDQIWSHRIFTLPACNYCDDIFSELADIVFMDAWLPEYAVDYKGYSLMIVRSILSQKMLLEGSKKNRIHLKPISMAKVIASQSTPITFKKKHLAYRLYRRSKSQSYIPTKRIAPTKRLNFLEKWLVIINDKNMLSSRHIMANRMVAHNDYALPGIINLNIFIVKLIRKSINLCSRIAKLG